MRDDDSQVRIAKMRNDPACMAAPVVKPLTIGMDMGNDKTENSVKSHCSVSIERSCVTKMTLEHIDVRFGNKTAHVSRHKTDDCDYEIMFEAVTHHKGSDQKSITEDEKQMIRDELSDWSPLTMVVS